MEASLIATLEALPIDKALRMGDAAFTTEDKAVINTALISIRGKGVKDCACRNRYTDALVELYAELGIKRKKTMKNYELKAGRLIWVDNTPYSNANLTDEIADKWRKTHENEMDVYFHRYPTEVAEKPLKPAKKAKK
jgi:hypothetical protein